MSQYLYKGTSGKQGSLGYLTQGQVYSLTGANADYADANPASWWKIPTPDNTTEVVFTSDQTLTQAAHGNRRIVMNNTSAAELTLPASPSVGDNFEIVMGHLNSADVTIEPGSKAVYGETTDGYKVDSVTITDAGTGYTSVPTVGFSGGSGSGAAGDAVLGAVSAVVATAGSGYVIGELITLAGGTETDPAVVAVATATAAGGTVVAPGSGYDVADTITIDGGTAATAAILDVATIQVVSVAPAASGSGYAIGEVITLSGGTSTTAATATVETATRASVAVDTAGTGYAVGDIINVAGGTATTTATVIVTSVGGSGEITGVLPVAKGDYSVLPSSPNSCTGGSGSGCAITLSWGVLTASVSEAGDYTVAPSNPVAQASSDGSGTGVTLTTAWGVLTVTVNTAGDYSVLPGSGAGQSASSGSGTGATFDLSWGALTVTVDTAGSYSVLPSNDVSQDTSDGSGTGAELTVTWGVSGVVMSNSGENYTEAPTVAFTDGGGADAAGTAVMAEQPADATLVSGTDRRLGLYYNGTQWKTY